VGFYNLEVNPDRMPSPKIAQAIEGGLKLIDYSGVLASFDDTAALIANLDIVLGCETAVTHLAGALGKPVWVIVDSNTHWVWQREGERTPWYPTARIFRQRRIHQWEEVFAEVRLALLGDFVYGQTDLRIDDET
jgi:ADP-heptose:LPS heptosyltransferase